MKNTNNSSQREEKLDKKMMVAIIFAVFGILLFIALALTLPEPSSVSK